MRYSICTLSHSCSWYHDQTYNTEKMHPSIKSLCWGFTQLVLGFYEVRRACHTVMCILALAWFRCVPHDDAPCMCSTEAWYVYNLKTVSLYNYLVWWCFNLFWAVWVLCALSSATVCSSSSLSSHSLCTTVWRADICKCKQNTWQIWSNVLLSTWDYHTIIQYDLQSTGITFSL